MSASSAVYFAQYAVSGRAHCREFRCENSVIKKDELRIGLPIENDWGTILYYHPACLWKTFEYRKNGNPKIKSLDEIRGVDQLEEKDVQVFQDLIENKKKKRKASDADGPKKRPKTTPFVDQLKLDYEDWMKQSEESDGEDDETPDGIVPAGEEKKTEENSAPDKAVLLYAQYHKKKMDELKDQLRWNRQVLKGNKGVVLHKIVDGHVNGRLACCPLDGGKLKFNDECTSIICSGLFDEDDMVWVPCNNHYSIEDAPRVHPWFTREPTKGESHQMDKLEAVAKGEESKFVEAGDGSALGELMKSADVSLVLDFSNKDAINASTQNVITFLQESKVEHDKEMTSQSVGTLLLANKDKSPAEVVKLLVLDYQKSLKKAQKAATGIRTYINCPFSEKDEAKTLGAKWDFNQKKWYVPGGKDISKFTKWMQPEGKSPTKGDSPSQFKKSPPKAAKSPSHGPE